MGNINKIVDSNGVTMVKYNYTAYGEVTMENPFRIFCLPKHFWNRFAFLIQYKKAKSSDIEWLIKQYN